MSLKDKQGKEKTLSEKIYKQAPNSERLPDSLAVPDVKQFIKEVLEEIDPNYFNSKEVHMNYAYYQFVRLIIKQKSGFEDL